MSAPPLEAIQFEQAVDLAATSHKDAANTPVYPVIMPENLHFDPRTAGGLVILDNGQWVTVRSPQWRSKENDPSVTTGDLMIMHGTTHATQTNSNEPRLAHEVEGWLIDPRTSEPVDISSPSDKHPELFGACREEATEPYSDLHDVALALVEVMRKLHEDAEEAGAIFYPAANLGHRALGIDEVNTHPYVQRTARLLGGLEQFIQLDGGALQSHIERVGTWESHRMAYFNLAYNVGPIMAAVMSSSPFYRGAMRPQLPDQYADRGNSFLATRFYGRMLGSPEAGPPIYQHLSGSLETFGIKLDERMRQIISSGGRAGGHHTDRFRIDLAPYGTTETAGKDANGHVPTILATSVIELVYSGIIERGYLSGNLARLVQEYPLVVQSEFSEADQARAAYNTDILCRQRFARADLLTPSARRAKEQAVKVRDQLLKMVNKEAPQELKAAVREASRIIKLRTTTPDLASIKRDEVGLPTARGYFEGGIGPLSIYMKARADALLRLGLDKKDAIARTQLDVARAHREHVRRLHPQRHLGALAGTQLKAA